MKYLLALFLSCASVSAWPLIGLTNAAYYFYVAPGSNVTVQTNGSVYTVNANYSSVTNYSYATNYSSVTNYNYVTNYSTNFVYSTNYSTNFVYVGTNNFVFSTNNPSSSLVSVEFSDGVKYVTSVLSGDTYIKLTGTNKGAISFRFLSSSINSVYFPTNWSWLSAEHFTVSGTNYMIQISNKLGYLSTVNFTPGESNIIAKYLQP